MPWLKVKREAFFCSLGHSIVVIDVSSSRVDVELILLLMLSASQPSLAGLFEVLLASAQILQTLSPRR